MAHRLVEKSINAKFASKLRKLVVCVIGGNEWSHVFGLLEGGALEHVLQDPEVLVFLVVAERLESAQQ